MEGVVHPDAARDELGVLHDHLAQAVIIQNWLLWYGHS